MIFSLLPILAIASNYAVNDQHDLGVTQEAWGRYVLSLPIPDRAALLVDSEKIAPLYYLQVTEKMRPDLDIMVLGDEALYRQELDRRITAGQPVYLARFLPNLPYRMRSLGPLVEVSREPLSAAPTIGTPINASFGDQIELLGMTEELGNPYRINLGLESDFAGAEELSRALAAGRCAGPGVVGRHGRASGERLLSDGRVGAG